MLPQQNSETPYAAMFQAYWDAGWRGVLPLPPHRKKSPPTGYSGYGGVFPSYPDARTWIDTGKYRCETADGKVFYPPIGNICLRLPDWVVGVDVDAYGDKTGGQTLRHAEELWGPLPPTVRSTARDDAVSGIRLYRVPPGTALQTVVRFPDEGLGNIEVCQNTHRYVVVWPSIHPDTGTEYRWLDHHALYCDEIPRPEDLPELPPAWLEALSAAPAPEVGSVDVDAALASFPQGPPDDIVKGAYEAAVSALAAPGGSRHDTVNSITAGLIRRAEQGHPGVPQALTALRWHFLRTVTADGSRSIAEAESEWTRMVSGPRIHALIAATPSQDPDAINAELRQLAGLPPEGDPDPPGFWSARPELATIRKAAYAQLVSPWSVLGGVLLRVAALVPHWKVLPPLVGGVGSLNIILCLVGESGDGKDSAMSVAEMVYPAPDDLRLGADRVESAPMGSGEGFLHQMVARSPKSMTLEERAKKDCEGLDEGMYWLRRSVIIEALESDTAKALVGRENSILLSTLRTLYSGGKLGQSNATPEKRLPIPKHSYRAGVLLGVQPEHGEWILKDQSGGLPQRCLWATCTDVNMPEPDRRPSFPQPLTSVKPGNFNMSRKEVGLPAAVSEFILQQRWLRSKGDAEALNAHAVFTREKVAYLLAVLAGRTDAIEVGDWELAGQIMAVSDATRAVIQRKVDARRKGENRAQAMDEAEREVIKSGQLEEARAKKLTARLQRKFEAAGGVFESRRTFGKKFDNTGRREAYAVLDLLIEIGRIREETDGSLTWVSDAR